MLLGGDRPFAVSIMTHRRHPDPSWSGVNNGRHNWRSVFWLLVLGFDCRLSIIIRRLFDYSHHGGGGHERFVEMKEAERWTADGGADTSVFIGNASYAVNSPDEDEDGGDGGGGKETRDQK